MSEILVRKAEAELLKKWRKRLRDEKQRAFEHEVLGQCIHELEEAVIQASALPDEDHWADVLVKTANAIPGEERREERQRLVVKATLRSYRWALLDAWSKRDGQ